MTLDTYLLKKYSKGKIIDAEDKPGLKRLASVGFMHLGTHVEINEETETIRLMETAGTTEFGKRVLRNW